MAAEAEDAVEYAPPEDAPGLMLAPEVETRPWAEQLAADDEAYRAQLAYLFERSAFYREKLAAAGVESADGGGRAGGDRRPAAHRQAGDPRDLHAGEPDRHASLRAPGEIVRIYSTSGTTGTPSYIPLTAGDLDNWVTGSARSYAASGIAAGQRIVSTYNAGPFVAGAALAAFERIGLCPRPGRHRQHRAAAARDRAAAARGRGAHALLRRPPDRVGGRARLDLAGSSVERVLVAGEPGGGEPAFRARLEEGWGARVTEAMGIGDIGVSLWGECEAAGRDAPRRARLRPRRADRARDRRGGRARRRRRPASSCSPICATAPRRCCAFAPATTSGSRRARARAGAPARACAASGAPTTC